MEITALKLIVGNAGLLLQTASALLFSLLFYLLDSNKSLSTYRFFISWLWLTLSLFSVVILYNYAINIHSVSNLMLSGIYLLKEFYLIGKGLFFIYLYLAILELCNNKKDYILRQQKILIIAWFIISVFMLTFVKDLNNYVAIQAPFAIVLLALCFYNFSVNYPGINEGIGKKVVKGILFMNILIWLFYLFAFPTAMKPLLQFNNFNLRDILIYNSYIDLLAQMSLAFSILIVIFEKSSLTLYQTNNKLAQLNSSLKDQSYKDPLTGSLNRRALDLHFKVRQNEISTFVLCDLDDLKGINDSLGHAYGDELIQIFVNHVQQSLRDGDNIYRIGGDEFIIWMKGCSLKQANTRFIQLLTDVPDITHKFNGNSLNFSFGTTALVADQSLSNAISSADKLMYQHKLQRKKSLNMI